jgi:hypothetical protein
MEGRADRVEELPGEHERGTDEHRGEEREGGSQRVDGEVDSDRDPVGARLPASDPGDKRPIAVECLDEQREAEHTDEEGDRGRDELGMAPSEWERQPGSEKCGE